MRQIFLLLILCFTTTLCGSLDSVRENLTLAARDNCTDEIIILRNGRPVYHYKSAVAPQRYDLEEMTGMFWSLAIGSLIEKKLIPCLDVPVAYYLPAHPSQTQLRAVLNHTSGFSHKEDFKLLEGIIGKASGTNACDYVAETFLVPMKIADYSWVNVEGIHHLMLRAEDLATVGWMLANKGQWNCKPLVSPYWMGILKKPSQDQNPFFGQQIWLEYGDLAIYWDEPLLNVYWKAGINQNFLCRLANFDGRELHFGGSVVKGNILRLWGRELAPNRFQLLNLITETYYKNLPLGHFTPGTIKSLIGWGGKGQQLVVMPEDHFVGVRLSAHTAELFPDFVYHVDAFTKEYAGWID